MAFHWCWNGNRMLRIGRWRVRDRGDSHPLSAFFLILYHQDNGAGSILAAFDLAGSCFVLPEIGIGDDKTCFGSREPHALLVPVQQGIQVLVAGIHG